MPPSKKDREAEAVAAEDAAASKLSRALFDDAVDARMVSRVRPSSLKELVPSKTLKRSDCKDIHKRSSIKKSRYMTVFPGQLAHLREGRIGSLAKLDTQNPVMYIEYPGLGRLKLTGTIVRSRATRYFSLNVKSKDRLQLEDWFDSMIVFSRYAWVGTADANPGEEPLPFPTQLKHVVAAAAAPSADDKPDVPTTPDVEFSFSVAADPTAKPKTSVAVAGDDAPAAKRPRGSSRSPLDTDDIDAAGTEDDGTNEGDAGEEDDDEGRRKPAPVARPRRESAKAARYDFDNDFDNEEEEEEEEERVFRGRATATVAKAPAPMPAPKRRGSAGATAGGAGAAAKKQKRAEVVAISDDDDEAPSAQREAAKSAEREKAGGKAIQGGGGQTSLLGFLGRGGGGGDDDGGSGEEAKKPAARQSAGVPRAAAPKKKFVIDSDDSDEDEEMEEDDDSDFEM